MKIPACLSALGRFAGKTLKVSAFLPGIITLLLPPHLTVTALAQSPAPAPAPIIDCCGGDAALAKEAEEASGSAALPLMAPPPKPTEFFKSSDKRVKPHGGRISLLNLDLTRPPTETELIQSGQLGSPLSPSKSADAEKIKDQKKRKKQEEDNHLFGRAMQKWNEHHYDEAVKIFNQHLQEFTDSPWTGEAELHLGCQAQFSGNWKSAGERFERILATHQKGQDIWQKAKLRRAVLHYQQAELDAAIATFAEMLKSEQSWERRTYAEALIRQIHLTQGHLAALKVCGPESLAYVFQQKGFEDRAQAVIENKAPSELGFRLGELANLAVDAGVRVHPISAKPEALDKLPTPFIAHYKDRHYTVVTDAKEGKVSVYDPRLKRITKLERAQFLDQWSGKGILFEEIPSDVDPASAEELQSEAGGCCGLPRYPDDLGTCPVSGGGSGGKTPKKGCGMPVWEVNPVNLNVVVQDTPIWHQSSIGPDFFVQISYNSQDSLNQFRPFGNKWMSNLTTYAVESPAQGGAGDVLVVTGGGKGLNFTPNGVDSYNSPADEFSTLRKTGPYSFHLTMPDGLVYEYGPPNANSTSSLLLKIRDRHNLALTIQYDANAQIDYVDNAVGNRFDFTYNSSGFVSQISDPWGRAATFSYNSSGDLIGQEDMGGLQYSYTYDVNKNLTAIGKPSGTWGFYVEPADGVANGSNAYPAPGGAMWTNYRVTITSPLGYKEEYHYNGASRTSWHRSPNQYQSSVAALSAPKTTFEFILVGGSSGRGMISKTIYADGRSTSYSDYTSTTNNTTRYQPRKVIDEHNKATVCTFNAKGNLLTVTDPKNNTTAYAYRPNGFDLESITDAFGNEVLEFTYVPDNPSNPNDSDRDVQSIIERVSATEARTTTLTYNAQGQVETVLDAGNQLFTLEYYPGNDPVAPHRLKTVHQGTVGPASALGLLTYDNKGRVASRTNTDGFTVAYTYDNLNRLATTTYHDNAIANLRTTDHTEWGCCTVKYVKDRLGRVTQFTYDRMNRLIAKRDPMQRVTQYRYDPNGNLVKLTDSAGNVTRWEYDMRDRPVRKIYADLSQFEWKYDGSRLWKTKDARGVEITYGYDDAGNLTDMDSTITPDDPSNPGNPIGAVNIDFAYNAVNNRETMLDSFGQTTWTYNWQGEKTGEIKGTDTLAWGYDAHGRMDEKTINSGASEARFFDPLGRLATVTSPLGTFSYSYQHATSGLLTSIAAPSSLSQSFNYFPTNGSLRLEGITNSFNATLVSKFNYTYDAAGQIQTWKREGVNPGVTQYTVAHDPAGQLMGAVLRSGSGFTTVDKTYGYGFDVAGNREIEVVDTAVKKDTINNLNQVTSRTGGSVMPIRGTTNQPVASVTIDGVPAKVEGGTKFSGTANVTPGNTVKVLATNFAGIPTQNEYNVTVAAAASPQTLTYDVNGNLKADGTRTYTWDALNRLTKIAWTQSGTAYESRFFYDGLSRRVKIEERQGGALTSTKRFVWDGLTIAEERDASNQLKKKHFTHGMVVSGGVDAGNYFYTSDHLGSVREVINSAGVVKAKYDYDPYGQRSSIGTVSVGSDFGFTGHYEHTFTGLTLAPFRTYDSRLGRWTSRDPVWRGELLSEGPNLYSYVGNEPIGRLDYYGLWQFSLSIGGFNLSFGHNSGQTNFSLAGGVGFGVSASLDLSDSGKTCEGVTFGFKASYSQGFGGAGDGISAVGIGAEMTSWGEGPQVSGNVRAGPFNFLTGSAGLNLRRCPNRKPAGPDSAGGWAEGNFVPNDLPLGPFMGLGDMSLGTSAFAGVGFKVVF